MLSSPDQSDRARALWLTCLSSAYRTAQACTIVAIITLYGPPSLRQQVAFPAFSFVTVILIASDATLGDTLRGFWLGLYATVQSIGPAILCLWLFGPARLISSTTAVAVGLAAFVVVLPGECTHLVSKRIALGQIVIVYVMAFVKGESMDPVMHPLHLAASTAVGVSACVLALLLPFPRLACREVKQNSKLLADNASERLTLFVKAFCADDNTSALASISQAKSLAAMATKLFQTIKRYQESMQWEKLPLSLFRQMRYVNPVDRFQGLEKPLRGMEMALNSIPSFPIGVVDGELKDALLKLVVEHMNLKRSIYCDDSLTVPESNAENVRWLQTLQTIPQAHQDLPPFFFLFCLNLLHRNLSTTSISITQKESLELPENQGATKPCKQSAIWSSLLMKISSKRVIAAFKCSLSLGLAVFFGAIFSKENTIWSGLPVAISFAAAREATFKVANVKAQGTVLGTVYGVFGCFLFQKFLPVRLFSLIPWFIFTSFLQRSKMYGQAGGISAVIGAVLILGRTNFGPPSEFAIARITETFIGLASSIVVELIFQPTRASTLAKIQLSKTLGTLQKCISSVSLTSERAQMEENLRRLKVDIEQVGKFIGEAEAEPNFWFLPFNSACYGKLLRSTAKMMELLVFNAHAIEALEQHSQGFDSSWNDIVHTMSIDLELFKKMVGSMLNCFKEITLIETITVLEKIGLDGQENGDVEWGKSQTQNMFKLCGLEDEEMMDKIVNSYLLHSNELVHKFPSHQSRDLKGQMVLCLSALGFCLSGLIRETRDLKAGIKELVQWENPSSHINLHEISCKIHALQK